VASDSPTRFLEAYVEGLDLQSLGFTRTTPAATGRPPYHPADLLKLYLYGYLYRIRSSRRLEAEATRNLEVIWLLRGMRPDFKTIADFRKDNREAFKPLFKQFNLLCRKLGLFGAELVAIDGSKFKALNNSRHHYSQKQLTQLLQRIESRVEDYLARLEQGDAEAEGMGRPASQELAQKITTLRESQGRYEELLKDLQSKGQKEVSLSDPESRKMKSPQGYVIGYNVQVAVDEKNHLIAAQEVVQESNDRSQLCSMALVAKEQLAVDKLQVLADKGYHEADQLAACEEAGLETYVPDQGKTSGRSKDGQQVFPKTAFTYQPVEEVYQCPAGQILQRSKKNLNRGKERVLYSNPAACRSCELKARCTAGAYRMIGRRTQEAAVERAARRVAAHPEKVARRKAIVEHVFGSLRLGGHDRFLLRGLDKTRAEFSLSALAYNLRRAINLVSIEELLVAATAHQSSQV
jgi:transposase